MSETQQALTIFGPDTIVIEQPTATQPFDRAAEWSRAYNQWLSEFEAANTRSAYERAWRDLLNYSGKFPWAIRPDDIHDWLQDLRQRPLDATVAKGLKRKGRRKNTAGYSPATIGQYLAAVSSFYSFVTSERYLVTDKNGREQPLHHINPAKGVKRPRAKGLGQQTAYLPTDELFALLRAIKQDTLQGLRDYAIFMGYVFTGRRNSEWRTLKWSNLEIQNERVNYVWGDPDEQSGKGKHNQKFELAPPVWEALQNYLKSAGRWGDMDDDDYLFTALNDAATRFLTVSEVGYQRQAKPLSMGQVNSLLKKYARKAGLDDARLHIHVLRHSAAMMLDDLGFDIHYISKHLGHSSVDMTAHYLDHMRGRQDQSWRKVAAVLKVDLLAPKRQGAKQ